MAGNGKVSQGDAAKRLHVTGRTLQRWDKETRAGNPLGPPAHRDPPLYREVYYLDAEISAYERRQAQARRSAKRPLPGGITPDPRHADGEPR